MPPLEPQKDSARGSPEVSLDSTEEPGFDLVEEERHDWNRRPLNETPDEHLRRWVRGILVLMAFSFTGVFGIALWLNPYNEDGSPRKMATHTQLGMAPCNMVQLIGRPCPSCGMTTSFALLMHGDVWNSMKANWVGTLLALFWMSLIPWSLFGAIRGRYLWVRSGELLLTIAVIVLMALLLIRWIFVLLST